MGKIILDETRIQFSLFNFLVHRGQDIVVPNVSYSWLSWEADIISFSNSGYMYEFEIKISKQDFEKDFKKRKHRRLKEPINFKKHNFRTPNYFSYVAPIECFPLCVPDYAGLFEVCESKNNNLFIKEVRKPKRIHKDKPPKEAIHKTLRTLMFKYWDVCKILDQLKIENQKLKEKRDET